MKPFKRMLPVRCNASKINIPISRTFVASHVTQNDKFNPQDFVSTGLKISNGIFKPSSQASILESFAAVPKDIINDSNEYAAHPQVQKLLDMLHDYDSLTLDLILKDPVILESTIQRVMENTPAILGTTPGTSVFVSLRSHGFSKEADLLIHILCAVFPQSDNIKLMTFKALMDLAFVKASSLQTNRDIIKKFIKSLLKYDRLLMSQLGESFNNLISNLDVTKEISSSAYLTQYGFFKFIIVCTLLSQKPLVASSFYISLINSQRTQNSNFINYLLLNNELLASIVNSLLVLDPKNHMKNLLTVIKLNEFQNGKLIEASNTWKNKEVIDLDPFMFKLSSSQQSKLLSNSLILDDDSHLFLKIHIFEKILNIKHQEFQKNSDQLSMYLRYSYQLIESNIRANNDARVYFIWSKINKYHTVLYNAQVNSPNNNPDNNYYYYSILSKLIKFFSKNQRYRHLADKLIQDVPIKSCVVNPELMDALLIHAARNNDIALSDVLIQQLGSEDNHSERNYKYITHLTRGQLSALLGLHLKFHDSEGVEKIVNLIYQRFPDGLDHIEMNMICKQMLSKIDKSEDQFEKIWKMYNSLDPYLGRSLATLIIDHMIENRKLDFEKIDIVFQKLVSSLKDNEKIWEWISSLYIKYLTRNFPLYYAKKVYQSSARQFTKYNSLNNPFSKPYDKARIYLPYSLRKLILKSILDSAVFHKNDQEIAFWCLEQLEDLGYGYKEIMLDLTLSKKDANMKTDLELDFFKTPKKSIDGQSTLGLSETDKLLSGYFDKNLEKLYITYLEYKNRKDSN